MNGNEIVYILIVLDIDWSVPAKFSILISENEELVCCKSMTQVSICIDLVEGQSRDLASLARQVEAAEPGWTG